MKTLQQFIEEACQEFDEKFARKNQLSGEYKDGLPVKGTITSDGLKSFLKEKLLESATLTAEAVKEEEIDDVSCCCEPFFLEGAGGIRHHSCAGGFNAAL